MEDKYKRVGEFTEALRRSIIDENNKYNYTPIDTLDSVLDFIDYLDGENVTHDTPY